MLCNKSLELELQQLQLLSILSSPFPFFFTVGQQITSFMAILVAI
jgi:hypothetical protein